MLVVIGFTSISCEQSSEDMSTQKALDETPKSSSNVASRSSLLSWVRVGPLSSDKYLLVVSTASLLLTTAAGNWSLANTSDSTSQSLNVRPSTVGLITPVSSTDWCGWICPCTQHWSCNGSDSYMSWLLGLRGNSYVKLRSHDTFPSRQLDTGSRRFMLEQCVYISALNTNNNVPTSLHSTYYIIKPMFFSSTIYTYIRYSLRVHVVVNAMTMLSIHQQVTSMQWR